MQYDEAVLKCFLEKQCDLLPEPVAETLEAADEFLSDVLAVVVDHIKEVWNYFDDSGVDLSEMNLQDIVNADEVFEVGDGRYLIVEA